MDIATLRQKLHSYVNQADRSKLLNLLQVVEDADRYSLGYEDGVMAELKERVEDYQTGKTTPISAAESKARLDKLRKQANQ